MEARLWIARTGCPWRDLPAEFPQWKSVYTRWRRWVQRRIWARVLAWLAEAHDQEAYAIDATYVRVHAHGTRARRGYAAQAVGRSRGGLTSKVHLLVDALGYPVRFVITGGECSDITQAPALLPPGTGAQVLCDRGYDADWWRARLLDAGHQPVIPGRRNRLVPPAYDEHAYTEALLIGTPPDQLVHGAKTKTSKGMTAEELARMENELESVERDFRLCQEGYGENSLHLNGIQRYVRKILENAKIRRFLSTRYPELLDEFDDLVALESL